jgi:hypothetical protein
LKDDKKQEFYHRIKLISDDKDISELRAVLNDMLQYEEEIGYDKVFHAMILAVNGFVCQFGNIRHTGIFITSEELEETFRLYEVLQIKGYTKENIVASEANTKRLFEKYNPTPNNCMIEVHTDEFVYKG